MARRFEVDKQLPPPSEFQRYPTEKVAFAESQNDVTIPAITCLSIYAAWVTAYLLLCWAVRHQVAFVVLCIAGLAITYCVHMGALVLYFDLSISYAKSSAEIDGIVAGDGAKLIFNAMFLAPAASLALVATGFAIRIGRPLRSGSDRCSALTKVCAASEHPEENVYSANPYSPPSNH